MDCKMENQRLQQSMQQTILQEFAREYRVQGEKVVAARTVSWFNDRYYGQWLTLNVPFRKAQHFIDEAMLLKVPTAHHYFAMAIACRHPAAVDMWHDDNAIKQQLKLECHTTRHAESVVYMVTANKGLVKDYIDGKLDACAEQQARADKELLLQRSDDPIAEKFRAAAGSSRREFKLRIAAEHEADIIERTKDVEGP